MYKNQIGLSLIELMIALLLGLLLMTGVIQIFLSSKAVFSNHQGMSRIQESGRLAMEFLSRDIRMAAYYGCYRPSLEKGWANNGDMVIDGLHGKFSEGIRGYDSIANLPDGKNDVGAGLELLESGTANVVVLRSANEAGYPLAAATTAKGVYVYSPNGIENNCIGNLCDGSAAIVSDCFKAHIFKINGVPVQDPVGAGNPFRVDHADAWTEGKYTTGELMPMNTTVYFLAKGTGSTATNTIPSLWQKTNADDAVELLQGVEQMRITYAVMPIIDAYKKASDLTVNDWQNVVSVRLELVLRSLENNIVEDKQSYTFAGAKQTPADGDRYMRQVFTSTVSIRSRAFLH